MSVTCTNCGESNSLTSTECWSCEARLAPSAPAIHIPGDNEVGESTCRVCGEKNPSSSVECWSCEARLNTAASINDVSVGSTCPVCGEHNPPSSTKCWSCETSLSSSSFAKNRQQTDTYRDHVGGGASAHDRTVMIARTQPRAETSPTAIADGVGKPRHASISRTPPKQSRFWFRAILVGTLLSITSSYLYWRETSFSPKSPAYNNFHDAYELQKYTEAIKIVRRHADRGNAEAQYALAVMNDRGQGTAVDHKTAYKLYRQAAAQGHLEATVLVKKIDAYEKAQSKH